MKLRKVFTFATLFLVFVLCTPSLLAQDYIRKQDIVLVNVNNFAKPVAGASVYICVDNASNCPALSAQAPVYSSTTGGAIVQPVVADINGNYFFYTTPGKYTIQITASGVTTATYNDVVVANDPNNPSFATVTVSGNSSIGGNLIVGGNMSAGGNLAGFNIFLLPTGFFATALDASSGGIGSNPSLLTYSAIGSTFGVVTPTTISTTSGILGGSQNIQAVPSTSPVPLILPTIGYINVDNACSLYEPIVASTSVVGGGHCTYTTAGYQVVAISLVTTAIPNARTGSLFIPDSLIGPVTATTHNGTVPLYSFHVVEDTSTFSSGTVTITLSNMAPYSSSTTYNCKATDTTTPTNTITPTLTSGTSITFAGTGTDSFNYTCWGY